MDANRPIAVALHELQNGPEADPRRPLKALDVNSVDYRSMSDGVTTEALEELFRDAGLGGRVGAKLLRAFHNSSVVRFAFAGDRLVGACRAITDGEYHAFVYDVAVVPDYQGQGVGTELMRRLLSGLDVWRVMLVADSEVQGFYRQFGFLPYDDVMAALNPQRLFD